jgi:hypothetical protein
MTAHAWLPRIGRRSLRNRDNGEKVSSATAGMEARARARFENIYLGQKLTVKKRMALGVSPEEESRSGTNKRTPKRRTSQSHQSRLLFHLLGNTRSLFCFNISCFRPVDVFYLNNPRIQSQPPTSNLLLARHNPAAGFFRQLLRQTRVCLYLGDRILHTRETTRRQQTGASGGDSFLERVLNVTLSGTAKPRLVAGRALMRSNQALRLGNWSSSPSPLQVWLF